MAPGQQTTRNIRTNTAKILETIIKLSKLNVPSLTVYWTKDGLKIFGTPKLLSKFEDIKQNTKEWNLWNEAAKNDIINLINEENPIFNEEAINDVGILEYIALNEDLKVLPAPLNECNYAELVEYLTYCILLERRETGLKGNRIRYGDPSWEPKECWLSSVWKWTDVKTPFSTLRSSMFPGPGNIMEFFKDCISKFLVHKGVQNIDLFLDKNKISEQQILKRRRRRGYHVEATK